MERRRFMKTASALAAAGATGVTGCLGEASDENVVWKHGVGGVVDAVGDGKVYGREDWRDGNERGVFGLGTTDGESEWTYGEVGGYSSYTDVVVGEGGVYFGYGDDAVGSGKGDLYALGTDGGERWVRDIGSVYDEPIVRDGVVYVGSDRGTAYAFGTDGEQLWRFDAVGDTPVVPSVESVNDGVAYVTSDGAVHAIDASDGEELWRYEGDDRVSTVGVADGTVYATLAGRVVAYAEGEELWSHEVEGTNSWIRGTAHGNVYFRHASELRVLDADDGKERWSVGFGKEFSTVLGEETVYAGVDDLTAFAPDGTEVWKADLGDSELDGITVTDDHVYAVTEERAHRIDGGEVVSSVDIPGDEEADSHVVGDDGRVYVGTREGVYALGV
jgi:outer membrane protein assembly factor BamB